MEAPRKTHRADDRLLWCRVLARCPGPGDRWWLARRSWGRGLATEAARIALRDAFERLRLDRIISIARPANTASTRIMEKLGLTFESEFESSGVQLARYAIDFAQYAALGRRG